VPRFSAWNSCVSELLTEKNTLSILLINSSEKAVVLALKM
jgi:hypothetical protein